MQNNLKYDFSFMKSSVIGDQGANDSELNEILVRLREFRLKTFTLENNLGFMKLPMDLDTPLNVQALVNGYLKIFKNLIVLGIGGSDLGARAVISALAKKEFGMKIFFLGGNTDPEEIQRILSQVNLSETLVNVISKSGDTIETMSTFIYIRDLLIKELGVEKHRDHIIATTDKENGTLKSIVNKEGYQALVVPNDVGGRFSVLSTVGLFPIACSGVDINKLLMGAQSIANSLVKSGDSFHQSEIFAALHYLGYAKRGQKIHVLVPYSSRLKEFGFWYRQLWAESLGKKDSLNGEEIYVGPTPIASLGSTDQHSQFQLYYFGPFDKILTFIDIEDHGVNITVPAAFDDIEGVSYMAGLNFNKIIRTELQASSLALAERKRANGRLVIPEISEFYIGQLIQFFEIATSYMAFLLNINAYDQPGVELGKQNMYALFDRPGFNTRKIELEKLMNNYAKYIV